jgi:hypothetical protein
MALRRHPPALVAGVEVEAGAQAELRRYPRRRRLKPLLLRPDEAVGVVPLALQPRRETLAVSRIGPEMRRIPRALSSWRAAI